MTQKRQSKYQKTPYNPIEQPKPKRRKINRNGKILLSLIAIVIIGIVSVNLWNNRTPSYEPAESSKVLTDVQKRVEATEDKTTLEYAELVARAFVIDFYTLADKEDFHDIGGIEYVVPQVRSQFEATAINTYYRYYDEVLREKEDLPEVSVASTGEAFLIKEYGIEGVMYQAVKYPIDIRYSNKENFNATRWPTKTYITLVLIQDEWFVVEISDQ